jgi:hypothetical protein
MRSKKSGIKVAFAKSVTGKNAHDLSTIDLGPIRLSQTATRSHANCLPEVQVDFAELEDGGLAEVVEDPTDPSRALFAIFKHGRFRLAERLPDRGRMLVPIPRDTFGFSDVKLPHGVKPYKSVVRLLYTIMTAIRSVIDVPAEYAELLSDFVLYTWVADRLPTAVYLSVVGLPQSGKSTLLELLGLLCRRALLVSDISQAAAYQACSNFGSTLLIDELDWHSSRTASTLRHLLRAGTNPASRALRVRHSSCSFGPKVFGSLEPSSDSALNSRCIQLLMAESNKSGLFKPGHPSILKYASDLRQMLLKFRFNSYKATRPAVVPDSAALRPRSRDILGSLAAPLVNCEIWTRFLLVFMKESHDPVTRESLEPRHEALHAALWENIHQDPPLPNFRIGGVAGLTRAANAILLGGGETITVTDKGVGRMLSSMGFRNTQRTKVGWVLWSDASTRARCHQLLKSHDNRFVPDGEFARRSDTCPSCKALETSGET